MIAKEKALRLFNEFFIKEDLPRRVSKICARICVDEMYDITSQNDNVIQMNYLVDVKKELESL